MNKTSPIPRTDQPLTQQLEALSGWHLPTENVLEWLLERLPIGVWVGHTASPYNFTVRFYDTSEYLHEPDYEIDADTPLEAALQLAIELFKQGVLSKEEAR